MMQIDEKIKKGGQKMIEKSRKLEAGRPKIEENWDRGCLQESKKREVGKNRGCV